MSSINQTPQSVLGSFYVALPLNKRFFEVGMYLNLDQPCVFFQDRLNFSLISLIVFEWMRF